MTFEEFQAGALKIGYETEVDKYGITRFGVDGVGVAYFGQKYMPFGCALCKYWSDDILIERLRVKVLLDSTPEIALDYLELLFSLERTDNDPNTDERQNNS